MAPTTRAAAVREAVSSGAAPAPQMLADDGGPKYRLRTNASRYAEVHSDSTTSSKTAHFEHDDRDYEIPQFIIDLSLPPEQRYLEVCAALKKPMKGLTPLFDELVGDVVRCLPVKRVHQLAKLFVRGVYDQEENRELKGISQATGIDMYLLVCFNVLLDLLMGCSSGGALVYDEHLGTKMVHFRTLDWGMPSLRKIIVRLDFKTHQEGPIIASSITYAGYVGVLTGVRQGLSISLNFKGNRRDKGKIWADTKYYFHLAMVLLGKRRSISSQLRCFLLSSKDGSSHAEGLDGEKYWKYSDVVSSIAGLAGRPLTTTACYLCFSNGIETTVIEKDRNTAVTRSSDEFIAVTNHDNGMNATDISVEEEAEGKAETQISLAEIIRESEDRRECMENNYRILRQRMADHLDKRGSGREVKQPVREEDVLWLLQRYPTTNEMTHFACMMDPIIGVATQRRWVKPVGRKWIREHQGFHRSKFM